jgi:hypothetical protein
MNRHSLPMTMRRCLFHNFVIARLTSEVYLCEMMAMLATDATVGGQRCYMGVRHAPLLRWMYNVQRLYHAWTMLG